jgi:hypothetical protein
LSPEGTNNVVVTNSFNWQSSWFGNYYQTTNSLLTDKGDRTADQLGLYHFTTQTNQTVEANSVVDIGYHYVATDTNGNPLDSNDDGIPDYLEDANGNGIVDNGETNWGLAIIIQPVNQTVPQGVNVTNNVTATGVAPVIYQWYFNGASIAGATTSSLVLSNVQVANEGSYFVVVTNFTGSLTSSTATITLTCDVTPSGLAAWWPGNGDANDYAGTNNGTLQGGASYTNGMVGQAFSFDGINQYMTSSTEGLTNITNSFTMEFWAYPTASLNITTEGTTGTPGTCCQRYAIFPSQSGSSSAGAGVSVGTNGISVFELAGYYMPSLLVYQAPIFGWTHVAVVYLNKQPTLYINGVLVHVGVTSPRSAVYPSAELGGDPSGYGYYAGLLDEVSIYNRALSSNEVAVIYNAGSAGKCLPPWPVPPVPTNLLATAISPTQISLTWDEVFGGATQISIERSTSSNGTYTAIAQVANALSYVDTNLTAGTTYYYQLQAVYMAVTWSAPSSVAWATTLSNGPNLPLSSLALWLKADAGLLQGSANMPVNVWADQSGNGNDAISPALANNPTWIPNAINGMPAVWFNATNSQYLKLPTSINPPSAAEAFVVLKAYSSTPSADRGLWTLGDSSVGAIANYPMMGGSLADNFYSTSAYSFPGAPTQPLTQYNVYEATSQNGNWMAWIDGIPQFQTTNNTYGAGGQVALGISIIFADGATQRYFDGDIAEILLFNRALTASERDCVGSYLFSKYGLSASTTNAAPVTAPTNLITTGMSPYQLNLQWLPTSTNAYSFHVERKLGTGGVYQEIGAVPSYVTNYVDTTACPTNVYYYRVRAHNMFGDIYSTAISPPTVSMTNWPVAILQYSTNLLGAQAADAGGSVSNVAFFANNQLVGITTVAPYTNQWIPMVNRQTSLSALATDNQGNSQFSAVVISYLDSNGDGIPDYLQVMQGNDPLNPWTPPAPDTNGPPIITLLIPTNAVIVP